MNLNEALEYALRLNNGRMHVSGILEEIKDKVIEEGVDASHLMEAARNAPGRYKVEDGDVILLRPERLADRVGFFREHLHSLREALRPMPSFNRLFALELALVHALALHKTGEQPLILTKGKGLWPILDKLAEEFPGLRKELGRGLEEAWVFGKLRVEHELLLMASARLTPIEYVLELRNTVTQEANLGQFALPWSVAELMARLLGDHVSEVYDPMADAGLLPAVLALNSTAKAEGVFLNPFAQFLSTLEARILGSLLKSSSFDAPPDPTLQPIAHSISAPPFGGKLPTRGVQGSSIPFVIAIQRIIERLADGGRAVILVPEVLLFANAHKALRQRLLTEASLSMIVRLPDGLFRPNANIKTSVLVIDRSSANKELIYIDARTYAKLGPKRGTVVDVHRLMQHLSTSDAVLPMLRIDHHELLQHDQCDLTADRWFPSGGATDPASGSRDRDVPLGALVSLIKAPKSNTHDLPYFQVAELAADAIDVVRTAANGRKDRPISASDAQLLNEPALLLARVGGNLKPSVFDPAEGPIALGTNVWAYRVEELHVDPTYLALELRSGAVQEQVNAFVTGSGVPVISKHDLLRLLVRVPPKEEQDRIVAEQLDLSRFMARLKRSGEPIGNDLEQFSKLITKNMSALGASGLKNVLLDLLQHESIVAVRYKMATVEEQLKLLHHETKNNLGWVSTRLGVVKMFIQGLVEDGIITEDMPVVPSLEGEESPSPSITDVLETAASHVGQLNELIDRLTEPEWKGTLQIEPIELEEFIRTDIAPLYGSSSKFSISVENWSPGATAVRADRFALKLVLNNIIANAIRHGFVDNTRKYNVHMVIMDHGVIIANDGEPPAMDLEELKMHGRKDGPMAGTGMGLYFVDDLLKRMGGQLTTFYNAQGMLEKPIGFALLVELPNAS